MGKHLKQKVNNTIDMGKSTIILLLLSTLMLLGIAIGCIFGVILWLL